MSEVDKPVSEESIEEPMIEESAEKKDEEIVAHPVKNHELLATDEIETETTDTKTIKTESAESEPNESEVEDVEYEPVVENDQEISFDNSLIEDCRDNADNEGVPFPCEENIVLCSLNLPRIVKTCKKTCGLCKSDQIEIESVDAVEEIVETDCMNLPDDRENCNVWLAASNACDVEGIKGACARACNRC